MRPTTLVLTLAVLALAPAIAAAQGPPDPDTCRNRPESRQLDFWIGTWDVIHPEDGRTLGVNVIEPTLNHCALMERWAGAAGGVGQSVNFYDAQRRTWRQVWVDDRGAVLDYRSGELRGRAMHFAGITISPAGDTTHQKLIFHDVAPDTVRQVFESSEDGGRTWSTDWVGIYVRRASGAEESGPRGADGSSLPHARATEGPHGGAVGGDDGLLARGAGGRDDLRVGHRAGG